MAVVASDSFSGMTTSATLDSSRTLDNALGGTGSRTWANTGISLLATGSGAIYGTNANQRGVVSMSSAASYKARIQFNLSGSTTAVTVVGQDTQSAGNTSRLAALVGGGNTLRIRQATANAWGGGTDIRNVGLTISTTSSYWLELEINNLNVTARVLDNTLSAISETSSSLGSTPGGNFWGFGFNGSGSLGSFDSWIVEDVGADGDGAGGIIYTPGQNGGWFDLTGGAVR